MKTQAFPDFFFPHQFAIDEVHHVGSRRFVDDVVAAPVILDRVGLARVAGPAWVIGRAGGGSGWSSRKVSRRIGELPRAVCDVGVQFVDGPSNDGGMERRKYVRSLSSVSV